MTLLSITILALLLLTLTVSFIGYHKRHVRAVSIDAFLETYKHNMIITQCDANGGLNAKRRLVWKTVFAQNLNCLDKQMFQSLLLAAPHCTYIITPSMCITRWNNILLYSET